MVRVVEVATPPEEGEGVRGEVGVRESIKVEYYKDNPNMGS